MRKVVKSFATTATILLAIVLCGNSTFKMTPHRQPPVKSRSEIVAKATELAEHSWICHEVNTHAACLSAYKSDFQKDDTIQGVAYGWGEIDSVMEFEGKLKRGKGAGCHSNHKVNSCTAGIDCSGLVALCWAEMATHYYTTRNLSEIATNMPLDRYKDLKPGDALVYPGKHVVLFVRYRADGNPTFYEASGRAGRVILNEHSSWSDLKGFEPIRYNNLRDP